MMLTVMLYRDGLPALQVTGESVKDVIQTLTQYADNPEFAAIDLTRQDTDVSEGVVKAGVDAARKVFVDAASGAMLKEASMAEVEKRVMSHESDALPYQSPRRNGAVYVIVKDEGRSDFRFVEIEDENGKSVACPWRPNGNGDDGLFAIRIDLAPKPMYHPDEAQQQRDDEWFNKGRRYEREHVSAFLASKNGNGTLDKMKGTPDIARTVSEIRREAAEAGAEDARSAASHAAEIMRPEEYNRMAQRLADIRTVLNRS